MHRLNTIHQKWNEFQGIVSNSLNLRMLNFLLSADHFFSNILFRYTTRILNNLDPDQDRRFVWSWSGSNLFIMVISRR